MSYIEEVIVFLKSIFHWFCYFIAFSFGFFFLGFKKITVLQHGYYLPLPSEHSFTVVIFNYLQGEVLPAGVHLITTNPVSAFTSQLWIAFCLGFLFTLPLLLFEFISYINPALLPREKKVVFFSLVPLALLFVAGAAFAYFFIIPASFKVLYPYSMALNAQLLFPVDEFIQYVFGLMLGAGLIFLQPLFMILLSYLRIIPARFWIQRWRIAILFFLVLSAIITPDGTGITMAMLFLPLAGLYFAGCYFAKRAEGNKSYVAKTV